MENSSIFFSSLARHWIHVHGRLVAKSALAVIFPQGPDTQPVAIAFSANETQSDFHENQGKLYQYDLSHFPQRTVPKEASSPSLLGYEDLAGIREVKYFKVDQNDINLVLLFDRPIRVRFCVFKWQTGTHMFWLTRLLPIVVHNNIIGHIIEQKGRSTSHLLATQ